MSRVSSLIVFILSFLSLRVLGQFIKLTTYSLIPFPPVINSLSASSTAWIQSWCFSSPRNSFLLSDSSLFRTACFFITNDSSSRNTKGSICPGSLACPLSSSCCSFFPHTQQVFSVCPTLRGQANSATEKMGPWSNISGSNRKGEHLDLLQFTLQDDEPGWPPGKLEEAAAPGSSHLGASSLH